MPYINVSIKLYNKDIDIKSNFPFKYLLVTYLISNNN